MDAVAYAEKNLEEFLCQLKNLVTIPSVSFSGFPKNTLEDSADAVMAILKEAGLENVRKLSLNGAHPYVYADHLHAKGKPKLLLYAHHDVQPPGKEEAWHSPPFVPTEREGPHGLRLYGRGAADDKAGIIVHAAAIASYLKTTRALPVNVKVIIEGEEEIGSPHLSDFLKQYCEPLKSDIMVLTDCTNLDCGVPALTVSLRGLVTVDVDLRSLKNSIHSGMWSGPIPDSAMALSKMLSTLVDSEGKIAVKEIAEQIPPLSPQEIEEFKRLPFDLSQFKKQCGLVAKDLLTGEKQPYQELWRAPSLTVCALQASSKKQAGNILNDTAWAKVSVRIAPGMDASKVKEALIAHLRAVAPWGVEVTCTVESAVGGWSTNPFEKKHAKVFATARDALTKGYGQACFYMGCGGTIPFVKPFAQALNDAPALLVGIEDPYTNAHGENESLLISDLKKAILSEIYLFQGLSEIHTEIPPFP